MRIIAYESSAPQKIESARKGKTELALYVSEPVIWFLHHIHGLGDWADAPLSIWMYDNRGMQFD